MEVNQKYLKDENGEIFSPITSVDSIFNNNENLQQIISNLEIEDSGWITATLATGVEASSLGYGGFVGIRYRKIGNRIYVQGSVALTWSGNQNMLLTSLPSEYKPSYNIYTLNPLSGKRIARIVVWDTGDVYLGWIWDLENGKDYTNYTSWLAIDINYPLD